MPVPNKSDDSVVHLVLRYSDRFLRGMGETISKHREVLKKRGSVWVGKIGRGVRLSDFLEQLKAGTATYLYLAKPDEKGFAVTRCNILQIQKDRPQHRTECIPEYYQDRGLIQSMRLWILVDSLTTVPDREWKRLHTRSSNQHVGKSLRTSSAAAFVVKVVSQADTRRVLANPKASPAASKECSWREMDVFEDDGGGYRDLFDDV